MPELDLAQLTLLIQNANADWLPDRTSVSELPPEQQLLRLGYTPGPGELSLDQRISASLANLAAATPGAVGYPASYDLRNVGGSDFITPVTDQWGCGSCVAFGSTATVEGTFRVERGDPTLAVDLSEAQLFYCVAASQGRNCGNGWWVGPALDAYINGIVDEACFPYTSGDQNCNLCADWQNRLTKISGWHTINGPADMKTWISTRGPLVTCFTIYADFYYYKSGVYKHVTGEARGGHCVCCVGYDEGQGCWICKNSWGTGWGDSGFFLIAYGECGIDSTMWAVEGIIVTTVLSESFALNQRIIFTGTDVNTGFQGAYVPVTGSSSTFTLPRSQDLEFRFDFWWTYNSGPSYMNLDLRFNLDGVPTAATRFETSATPQLRLILPSVLAGSHTLTVEVRSVLVDGPPTDDVTLYGNSDAYFSGGPGIAKLEIEGAG